MYKKKKSIIILCIAILAFIMLTVSAVIALIKKSQAARLQQTFVTSEMESENNKEQNMTSEQKQPEDKPVKLTPVAIQNITAQRTSASTIEISWTKPDDASMIKKYLIKRCAMKAGSESGDFEIVSEALPEQVDLENKFYITDTLQSSEPQQFSYRVDVEVTDETLYSAKEGTKTVVSNAMICIDPGHYANGSVISAENSYSYIEGVFTLKIGLELKRILQEKYGISSYMTRETGSITLEGYTDEALDGSYIDLRGRYAAQNDSNLFISLHTNANNDNANGYPTCLQPTAITKTIVLANSLACSSEMALDIANSIGVNVSMVNYEKGLSDMSDFQKVDENNIITWTDAYNDSLNTAGTVCKRMGDYGDYYGVLRGAAIVGVPGIIVEHGLHTVAKLRQLAAEDGNYVKQTVSNMNQLNNVEAISIDMVADVSGSMDGSPLYQAKSVMTNFINSVQFSAGDKVELTSFSTGVYINQEFSNNAAALISDINSLMTGDMTSLYDALYTSVTRVASQSGARCVIAFTDGQDNYSGCSREDVVSIAQRYHIPIFIIGVGDEQYIDASYIASQTGGEYYSVYDIYGMEDIYNDIYREEKCMYFVEFTDESGTDLTDEVDIVAGYHSREYQGECYYNFQPNMLVSVDSVNIYNSGPEATVEGYLKGFDDAMTNQDFSYISSYLQKNSNIYNSQKDYVKKGIFEQLDSYEIVSVDYSDKNNCVATTRETFYVQKPGKPLHLMTQQCQYVLQKSGNDWKMIDFASPVEVLYKINS